MEYSEKVEWLMRYRVQKARVESLKREYKQKLAILKEQESLDKMPFEAETGCRKQAAARLPRTEAALKETLGKMRKFFDEIDEAIDALEDDDQRAVLREIYLAGASQEATAETQHMCKRKVGRKHRDGVEALKIPGE